MAIAGPTPARPAYASLDESQENDRKSGKREEVKNIHATSSGEYIPAKSYRCSSQEVRWSNNLD
jgi:hypothetical protein